MELWLTRAGQTGEYEDKFLNEGRIYLTWSGLSAELSAVASREALLELLKETYPDGRLSRLTNHATQIWSFSNGMEAGDWVVLPSKKQPVITSDGHGQKPVARRIDKSPAQTYHQHSCSISSNP